MSKANICPYESEEQENFVNYLNENNIKFFAVPNGSNKSKYERFKFQAEGLQAGVPDLVILANSNTNRYNILFIEMKRKSGGQLSKKQKEWINWLDKNNYAVAIANGCEDAIVRLNMYLKIY